MAKVQHLHSETAGNVPSSLLRGQLAINIPDKIVYANTPDGKVAPISNGNAGVANANSLLGVHIPVMYHPVAQFAPGYTEAQLTSMFTDDGVTAALPAIPVFAFGTKWYVPATSCPSINTGAYIMTINTVTRSASLSGQGIPLPAYSGTIDYVNKVVTLVIKSDGHIYPWFYLPQYRGLSYGTTLFRISPYRTFGAIPVSTGFPGANAASYWGNT